MIPLERSRVVYVCIHRILFENDVLAVLECYVVGVISNLFIRVNVLHYVPFYIYIRSFKKCSNT